jgi:GH18 family chitinase
MEAVRKLGIGIVIEIGNWGDAQFFADISADKNKRTQFITFVHEVAQNYSAAGIGIKWTSPSCKQVGDTFSLFYLDNLMFNRRMKLATCHQKQRKIMQISTTMLERLSRSAGLNL